MVASVTITNLPRSVGAVSSRKPSAPTNVSFS